ncbi:hypothetical protein [Methanocella arvoryzae]|uniref:Uncharacterized protein n=1 Tax=Methanocella arvoryzae (strain DSM 22066 / NBRC 105507 / MRE50) TaxID=351160 RepID=Q0W851_METAR|nr:hypothetical protein [Methanocella arvoryzae]CAJ35442.1 hypothetical protein LRC496 [Methanocella arvoryzae MRE50]
MELEGNMLLILLVGLSLAIVIIVVAIRLTVKKDSDASDGLLLPVLNRGHDQQAAEEAETETIEPDAGSAGTPGTDDLSLPEIEDLDGLSFEPEENVIVQEVQKPEANSSANLITVITDLLRGIFSRGKVREETKQEVQNIDEQLEQVLRESQNIGLDISSNVKIPNLSTLSESKTMREIDTGMRNQQPAQEKKPEAQSPPESPEGLNPYTQAGDMGLNPPDAMASAPQDPAKPKEERKPDLSLQPLTPKPPESGSPENAFTGEVHDAASDLLSEIAAETVKEEVIDTSIMKDLEGVPISCEELEKDLTVILDQISVNVQASGKKKKADRSS